MNHVLGDEFLMYLFRLVLPEVESANECRLPASERTTSDEGISQCRHHGVTSGNSRTKHESPFLYITNLCRIHLARPKEVRHRAEDG